MKKIFFYTDILPFLAREYDAICKLQRSLEIFREASEDIQLVWHPWSRTVEYLELNNSPAKDKYCDILNSYRLEGWGVLDETNTIEETKKVLLECNAYYGDSCELIYEAQNAKIPIMIQNIDV